MVVGYTCLMMLILIYNGYLTRLIGCSGDGMSVGLAGRNDGCQFGSALGLDGKWLAAKGLMTWIDDMDREI